MNWEAIGAVGEIAGALAVIMSLLYLASQIRENNKSTRYGAVQNLLDNTTQFLGRLSSDKETMGLWIKGMELDESLTQEEWIRFGLLCMELTYLWERVFYLKQTHDIDPYLLETSDKSRKNIMGAHGYRYWFRDRKDFLSDDFSSFMISEMESNTSYRVSTMPTRTEIKK